MAFRRWPVPVIDTVGELAAFLELEVGALEWFADVRGLERIVADERLRHYRYRACRAPPARRGCSRRRSRA